MTILWALSVKDPVPVRRLNPNVPPALSDLIGRLLAKDPNRRPRTAGEVVDALRAIDVSATPGRLARPPRWGRLAAACAVLLLGGTGYLYGPAVYRLSTNQGTVVVETDDPDVKVVVKTREQEITIIDARTKREVTLKAGKYELELSDARDGLRLSATEFTLDRGGRQVVKVRREPVGLVHTLVGHRDFVWSAAFCLRGTHVLSAAGNRHADRNWVRGVEFALRLWNVQTGQAVGLLDDHTEIVHCVAVSPDGRWAVSAGGDGAAAKKGEPGGKDFALRLWDLEQGEQRWLVRRFAPGHTARVNGVAFTPDGRQVVSASHDRTVRVWDVETGRQVRTFRKGENEAVWSVAVSPDGRRVLSGNAAGVMRVWDVQTGDLVKSIPANDAALGSVTFSPDGRRGLTQGPNHVARVWDLDSGQAVFTLTGHRGWLGRLAFSPDGRRILTGSDDRTVRLWDAATGKELRTFPGHENAVYQVAFSPDGRRAVSASWDKTIKIWNLPD